MAEVIFDPNNKNTKELLGQGIRAYVVQDYNTAIQALSKASEIIVSETQDELHDSLGDVYLYYGKSLLEFSRSEAEPLGDAVPKTADDDDEDENEEEEVDKVSEETPDNDDDNADEEKQPPPKEDNNVEPPKKENDNNEEPQGSTNKEEPTEEEEEDKEGEEEELSDLELAWSVLELAKKIFTARNEDGKKNLAETHVVLGEVSLESENFETAIDDIKKGLELQKEIFSNDSRTIAESAYKLGVAYSTNSQFPEAIDSFKLALEFLQNRINILEKNEDQKDGAAEEIEEIKSLIPDIEEKVADMRSCKEEAIKKILSSVTSPKTNGSTTVSSNSSTSGAGSSTQASDISHLVKRKRKVDDNVDGDHVSKKPSP